MAKKSTKKYKYVTKTFTLPDGTRKYVYGKTDAEAAEKLAELKRQVAGGVDVNDNTTFGEVAKVWIDEYYAPFVRESTVSTKAAQLNARVMPRFAAMRVKDITPLMIRAWFSELVADGCTIAAPALSSLRKIFDVAVELGCIAKNPVPLGLKAPAHTVKKKEVLPEELREKILRRLKPLSKERLFFQFGVQTGMRRGEILALKWDCIDLDEDVIKVRRNLAIDRNRDAYIADVLKTADGCRDLPIPPTLHQELLQWREYYGETSTAGAKKTDGYLFCQYTGEIHSLRSSWRLWDNIRNVCGEFDEDYAKNFTSHVLRHTYITRLFEAGLDVKEIQTLAGHKDVQTTLATYIHYDKQRRQESTFTRVKEIYQSVDTQTDEAKSTGAKIIQFPGADRAGKLSAAEN